MNSKLKQPYDYLNCYIYICIESASESLFGTYYDEHGGLFGVNAVIFFCVPVARERVRSHQCTLEI